MTTPHSMPGTKAILLGATGTGKTYAIQTLVDAGITPFVLFTEPGMRTLGDVKCDKLHYKYIPPSSPSWDALHQSATKINSMGMDLLSKLKDINKKEYGQFLEVLTTMNDFTCDRCGESFGDVSDWQTDRAIVIDSLSGLNIMAMDLVVGSKPVKSMSDWGISMDNLERFINKLAGDTQCHFVLTAHLEREVDEVLGGVKLMASTLGKKLAPRLPRFFDDVIVCERKGTQFSWSTAAANTDLKARNLPIAENLPATFVPLVKSWEKAGGIIQPTMENEGEE